MEQDTVGQLSELAGRIDKLLNSIEVGDVWTECHWREAAYLQVQLDEILNKAKGEKQ